MATVDEALYSWRLKMANELTTGSFCVNAIIFRK
jgi:hypothetical protein